MNLPCICLPRRKGADASPYSSPINSNTWLPRPRGEKLGARQQKGSFQTCARRALNGAKQINVVTQLFITLAFKSLEPTDLVLMPTLREHGIQFCREQTETRVPGSSPRRAPAVTWIDRTAGGHAPSAGSRGRQRSLWRLQAHCALTLQVFKRIGKSRFSYKFL